MKIAIKSVIAALSIAFLAVALAAAQTNEALPVAGDVVARMLELDAQRHAQLNGYTATRHYVAANRQRRAEMVVRVTCTSDGTKQFSIVSEEGSSAIRKHVFYKMLKEESEASHHGTREGSRIVPANYQFRIVGKDVFEGRPAYVLQITPKEDNRYLINGRIWVDAIDYSIVRIEGSPAKNPSFWIRGVHFVHTYQKVGPYWFAASTHSVSQVRIFGDAELTIENSGYTLNSPSTTKTEYEARVVR